LNGGSTILLSLLNNGSGVRRTDLEQLDLRGRESTTPLSSLNQGAGVRQRQGQDFRITLTDGKTIDVDLAATITTLQGAIDAIVSAANAVAAGRLAVVVNPDTGNSLLLRDLQDLGGDLEVTALEDSEAAADLGILRQGNETILRGTSISDLSADLRVTLGDSTQLDFDLSGLTSLAELLEKLNSEDPRFSARINSEGTGLTLRDATGGTSSPFRVVSLNGSMAATDLGITATGSGGIIPGVSIVGAGTLRLDGRLDHDRLIGGSGDDVFIVGGGNDQITGGGGIDTVVAERDTNFVLTNTSLTFGSGDVATISGIERANITGGDGANTLDASAFTLGSVTLNGRAGDDILKGGSGDDFLSGGAGMDRLDGGAGVNTVVEQGARAILTTTTLELSEGRNEVSTVSLTGNVTGGRFTLTYQGQTTDAIPHDANYQDV
jgi:Ca2+-binding RTX toxin-like protein